MTSYEVTHPHAATAIWAAENESKIGFWAAWRYCQKRGVPSNLFVLARVLRAASKV